MTRYVNQSFLHITLKPLIILLGMGSRALCVGLCVCVFVRMCVCACVCVRSVEHACVELIGLAAGYYGAVAAKT